jgi:hypothetical protein
MSWSHVNPQMTVTQLPEGLLKVFRGVQGGGFSKKPPWPSETKEVLLKKGVRYSIRDFFPRKPDGSLARRGRKISVLLRALYRIVNALVAKKIKETLLWCIFAVPLYFFSHLPQWAVDRNPFTQEIKEPGKKD